MNITVQREASVNGATFGKLLIEGHEFCDTLEDEIRELPYKPVAEWKVKGETAIPAGTYTVIVDFSSRFNKLMPHLLGIEGFSGVRIHSGNTAADTEGCILVGFARSEATSMLLNSRSAFEKLFDMMKQAQADGERVIVMVCNPVKENLV